MVVSRLVPFPTEYSTRFVALSYVALQSITVWTPFYYVCHVMLRLSRMAREVQDLKWHILGTSSFILEQSLRPYAHYAIEEEIKSRTFLINSASAVVIISKSSFLSRRHKGALNCMIVSDLTERQNVLRPGQNATDWSKCNRS